MSLALLALGFAQPAAAADVTVPLVGEEVVVTNVPIVPSKPDLKINIIPYGLNTQVYTFPSGLRIMFQDDDTLPVVAVTTVYDHGAGEDPTEEFGLAHLMEHMWFRSKHGDLPAVWPLLYTHMGCNINAFTQYDITAYMSVCPSDQLDTLMRLESLRMAAPLRGIEEEMVATEIEVVRNEIRMRTENGNIPFFPLLEAINKLTLPEDHPYHRPMAGDHTTMRNIDLQDIQDWIEPRYVPASTTIMFVGDLDFEHPQDVITAILKNVDLQLLHPDLTPELLVRFPKDGIDEETADPEDESQWWLAAIDPESPEDARQPLSATVELEPRYLQYTDIAVPEKIYDEMQTYESTVEDPTVIVAWTLPPGYQGNDMLMNLTGGFLSGIIEGFPGSPLGELEDANIKEFGGCGPIPNKLVSTFICTATLKDASKNPERTAERIIDRLYLLTNPDMQRAVQSQLSLVRMDVLAGTLRSLDLYAAVGAGRATDIALYSHFRGRPDVHSAQMNEAMTLQVDAMTDLVQHYITRDRASTALVKPLDRDDVLEVSGDGSEHYNVSNKGVDEDFLIPLDKVTPERIRESFNGPDFGDLKEYEFSSGLRVVVAKHGEAPVARAVLLVNGGSAQDLDGVDYWRFLTTDVEWSEEPLQIAGRTDHYFDDGHEALMIEASAGNLDGMLWMLRDAVENMRIDTSGKGEWYKDRKDDVVSRLGDRDWHVADMVNQHVNAGHPNYTYNTMDDYKQLTKTKKKVLREMLAQKWQPSNATLLIVGNVDHGEALEMAKTYFGGWHAKEGTPAYTLNEVPAPNPVGGNQVLVFDDPGKTQTAVELTCPAQYVGGDVAAAHRVMGVVLSNELSSILRKNSGVVYSPYAYSVSDIDGDARTVFGARVQNSASGFTIRTYYDLIELIENGEFDINQITMERYSVARKYGIGQQSMGQMTDRLEYTIGLQRDWTYFDRYRDSLADMGMPDLQAVMGSCLENAIVTLVGPEEEVTARLDEAGVAYEVVDWKQRGYDLHKEQDPRGYKKAEKKRLKAEAKAAKEDPEEEGEAAE